MGPVRRAWRRWKGAERGATAVEYALVTAVLLFASLGAIKALDRNSRSYYNTTSSRIGDLPTIDASAPTGTSIPVASSTTTVAPTTTTAAPTTTTTAAPTTTTTAAPTTTTTAPTTTTTAAPLTYISATSDASDTVGTGTWRPALMVTLRNSSTNALVNGASVTVTFRRTSGTSLGTASCTTSSGVCTARISGTADRITTVVATVTAVTSTPTWNGSASGVTLTHP